MADAAELHDDAADDFDAEFEAARVAELEDETGLDDEAEDEEHEGDDETGETEVAEPPVAEAQPSVSAEADKLSRRVKNLDKALKAERREKRELADQVKAIQAQLQAKAAPQPEAVTEPDPDEDPIGWMKYARKRLQEFDGQSAESARRQEAEQAQTRQFQALNARVTEAEADFRIDHPDYDDAAKHLQQSIRDELAEQGYTGQQLASEFSSRMIGIATRALQTNKDPAEVSYNLAKRRGFAPAAPAPAAAPQPSAVIERLQAGQKAAKTLIAGGARDNTQLTPGAVANLKGAAFDAAFEKLRAQERRR